MEEFFGKKYKLTKSENFEEFMKAAGINFMIRKIVPHLTPIVELRKDGDVYILITSSTFRTVTLTFKLNEEFDEMRPDGVKAKTTCTLEGNKLIQIQKNNNKIVTVEREFFANEIITIMKADDVICTRIFTLISN